MFPQDLYHIAACMNTLYKPYMSQKFQHSLIQWSLLIVFVSLLEF